MSTAEQVIGVILDYSGKDATSSDRLYDDLDMDDLDVIEIVMDLEDEFDIEIDVQDVISVLQLRRQYLSDSQHRSRSQSDG